jgi:hypothetical protein
VQLYTACNLCHQRWLRTPEATTAPVRPTWRQPHGMAGYGMASPGVRTTYHETEEAASSSGPAPRREPPASSRSSRPSAPPLTWVQQQWLNIGKTLLWGLRTQDLQMWTMRREHAMMCWCSEHRRPPRLNTSSTAENARAELLRAKAAVKAAKQKLLEEKLQEDDAEWETYETDCSAHQ